MRFRRSTVLALLLLTIALPITPAGASCLFDDRPVEDRLGEFEYVFKGRVVDLRDEDRTARFEVEEVWRGALGPETIVYGGPEQPPGDETVATSNDRAWAGGAEYLVFATTEPRGLVDNACSPTREWTDDLAAARPADWTAPESTIVDDDDDGPSGIGALGIIGGVVLALAGIGALLAHHRRTTGDA